MARDLGPPRSNRPHPRRKASVGLTVHCGTACRRGEGIPSRGGFPAGRSWVSLTRVLFLGSDALSASYPTGCVTSGLPLVPAACVVSDTRVTSKPTVPCRPFSRAPAIPTGSPPVSGKSPSGSHQCPAVSSGSRHRLQQRRSRFRLLLGTDLLSLPLPQKELICDFFSPQPRSRLRRPGPDTLCLYASSTPPTSRPKFGGLSPRVAGCHLR
jgi:hypothetical protein